MALIQKFVRIESDGKLGARQIRIIASDATPDRVGDVMVPNGCDVSEYAANPIVLAQHNPDAPIGRCTVEIKSGKVVALIDFAPEGISPKADEYCGLTKAGIVSAASIGFDPIESEPLPGGGKRYTRWKLLEISLVSVPANPAAIVVERSARSIMLPARLKRKARAYPALMTKDYSIESWVDAWLRREWPDICWLNAMEARLARRKSLPAAERAKEREREQAFRRDFEMRALALTPEQQADLRRREITALAPPIEPFRWNPSADPAVNSFNERQASWRRKW